MSTPPVISWHAQVRHIYIVDEVLALAKSEESCIHTGKFLKIKNGLIESVRCIH